MKTIRRQRSGGWVLAAVLAVLLLLSLLVAGFYAQSQDATAMTRVSMGQQLALSHAEFGVQEAVRGLRAQQVPTGLITTTCTDAEVAGGTCPAGGSIVSDLVDNGPAQPLSTMGGLQYQYVVYRRTTTDAAQPPNRFVVRSTGFYGYCNAPPCTALDAAASVTTILEVEVDVGNGSAYECTGGYECQ
jgi:hypothetical protein